MLNNHKQKKKILFLGYSREETRLINFLENKHCIVDHSRKHIEGIMNYNFAISFGYRHVLSKETISNLNFKIINLHISYLPFNRGAHPNFWSHYEGTPSGVTIHLMDEGIDTGPILFQKYVSFKKEEKTFNERYRRLNFEIEELFIKNIEKLLNSKWILNKQKGKGTYHNSKDLPNDFSGWDSIIDEEIKRLKS